MEGTGTAEAFQTAYVNISNNSGKVKWAQLGYTRRRDAGATTPVKYRKAEVMGNTYKLLRDTANAPADDSIHDYRIELDKSTGTWSFIDDGSTFFTYTDAFWTNNLGTDVQWTGEILNYEDDMPGTDADKCSFTECQYKIDGGIYQDAGLTSSDVMSDDQNQWGAEWISGTALNIWDKHPN
jgi:hypothetical protein